MAAQREGKKQKALMWRQNTQDLIANNAKNLQRAASVAKSPRKGMFRKTTENSDSDDGSSCSSDVGKTRPRDGKYSVGPNSGVQLASSATPRGSTSMSKTHEKNSRFHRNQRRLNTIDKNESRGNGSKTRCRETPEAQVSWACERDQLDKRDNRRSDLVAGNRSEVPKTGLAELPYKFVAGRPVSGEEAVTRRVANAFLHSSNEQHELAGSEALHVLWDLGLLPRSLHERRAVAALIEEYDIEARKLCFEEFEELTQLAREQVMQCQQPRIEKHFLHIRGDKPSHERCPLLMDFDLALVPLLLRSLGCSSSVIEKPLADELRQVFATCPKPDDNEEHEVFQSLVQHSQERLAECAFEELKHIMLETGLNRYLSRDFRRELPELFDYYTKWVNSHSDADASNFSMLNSKIEFKGVLTILGDLGVVPTPETCQGQSREMIMNSVALSRLSVFKKSLKGEASVQEKAEIQWFNFSEFLCAVQHVRRQNIKAREPELLPIWEKYAEKEKGDTLKKRDLKKRNLDLRCASLVLNDCGLTPRSQGQQQVIAELFMDLDERGTSAITFAEIVNLVCRIIERKEQKSRAQFKAYATSIGLNAATFQDHVCWFEELHGGQQGLGQRTTRTVLTTYGKNLSPEAFLDFYSQLDTNFNHTLELPEFLRLVGHLERERSEIEEIEAQKAAEALGKSQKGGKKEKKTLTPFTVLPPSFEEFLPLFADA